MKNEKQLLREANMYLKEYYLAQELIGRRLSSGGPDPLNCLIIEIQEKLNEDKK